MKILDSNKFDEKEAKSILSIKISYIRSVLCKCLFDADAAAMAVVSPRNLILTKYPLCAAQNDHGKRSNTDCGHGKHKPSHGPQL